MNVTLAVSSLDVSGNTATAKVTGVYEFVYRDGRADKQQVSFEATFQRDAPSSAFATTGRTR